MYLHLGQDTVVRSADVVGIFDMENTSVSRYTKEFLAKSEKDYMVCNVSYELPKSFVLCQSPAKSRKHAGKKPVRGRTTVYITQISTATLRKRADFMEDLANMER